MSEKSNKSLLIGFGILLGLLFALTLYLFFENRALEEVIKNHQNDIENVSEESNKQDGNSPNDNISKSKGDQQEVSDKEEINSEQALWQTTKKINTFDGYLELIKSVESDGTHNQESISKLFEFGTSGWLYSGRTSGGGKYSEDQMVEVTWRKDGGKDLKRRLPEKGDVVRLISNDARRTYPHFLPRIQQNGIWQVNSNAYVLDARFEGKSAVIIKVVYD